MCNETIPAESTYCHWSTCSSFWLTGGDRHSVVRRCSWWKRGNASLTPPEHITTEFFCDSHLREMLKIILIALLKFVSGCNDTTVRKILGSSLGKWNGLKAAQSRWMSQLHRHSALTRRLTTPLENSRWCLGEGSTALDWCYCSTRSQWRLGHRYSCR